MNKQQVAVSKHEFALYLESLSAIHATLSPNNIFTIDDPDLVHRITHVLRLAPEETLILFDRTGTIQIRIREITKKKIVGILQSISLNTPLQPHITFFLPLLKRHDLETALYSLTEIGVQEIFLISTHKTQKGLPGSEKEFERLQRIIIAAAEQSKNFCFPTLRPPAPLEQALELLKPDSTFIHFDPAGQDMLTIAQTVVAKKTTAIFLMVGPEGDMTFEEQELIKKNGALFCALTPTVLRSVQAISIGAGVIRSVCF